MRALVDPNPKTKERIAEWLRKELGALKAREREVGSAPIFSGKMLSRTFIGDVAITMLQFLGGPPSDMLICLLQELLDVDRHRMALVKSRPGAFVLALLAEAQAALQGEVLGVRELAKRVSVRPSTITRWRRLDEYGRDLLEIRKSQEKRLGPLVEEILEARPGMRRELAYTEAIRTHDRWTSTLPHQRNKAFEAELKDRLARAKTAAEVSKIFERHVQHRVEFDEITKSEGVRLARFFDDRIDRIRELKRLESVDQRFPHSKPRTRSNFR